MTGVQVTAEELKSLLVDQLEVIDEVAFEKASSMANRLRVPLEHTLAERGHIPLGFLLQQLAQAWDVGFIDLRISDVYSEALRLERSVANETSTVTTQRRPGAEDPTAVDLVTRILEYAAVSRASDIHIEPYELEAIIRYRIDGTLQEVLSLPAALLPSLVARIKILASLRIDERRAPQDGRFEADLGGFKIGLRVSSLPTHWGEKVVLRVLSKEDVILDLEDLGLGASDFDIVLRNILRPFGMVLITGPTGSGKTTSLYAMIMRLGAERQNALNISTVEDPVEYTMPRVNQVQINPVAGIEFGTGLRARPDFEQMVQILQRQGVLTKGDDPLAGLRLFRGKGCPQCRGSGLRGRLGVFELFEVNDHIRSMIMERQDTSVIRAEAIAGGMKTMFQDGVAKAFFGETTLEEVFRVAV